MGFMLHLIYFDSCKNPGLIIHVDAVKMQRVEKGKDTLLSEQFSKHLKNHLILPKIAAHAGDSG